MIVQMNKNSLKELKGMQIMIKQAPNLSHIFIEFQKKD